MNEKELIEQNELAFDFINKLYMETSVIIKEIEGILKTENEEFIIARPSGYAVTSPTSMGLDNVEKWSMKRVSVAFIPSSMTKVSRGQTNTQINGKLKILYFRFIFSSDIFDEPNLAIGVLSDLEVADKGKRWVKKYENAMNHIEINENKFFGKQNKIDAKSDVYIHFKGEFKYVPLFEINKNEDILNKIIKVALELYRK